MLDWNFTEPSIKWFDGATTNITLNALDRHIEAGFGEAPAVTWEADDGSSVTYSFSGVLEHVSALCHVLEAQGVKRGDRVSVVMPMIPQLSEWDGGGGSGGRGGRSVAGAART